MRAISTLFVGLVLLTALVGIAIYIVHVSSVATQAIREQQMLYEKARYIADHTNISGNTITLPQPADLIIIDPSGVPHVAKNVKQLQLPWPASETKIYVVETGRLRVGAADPVASSIAALASVAAAPLSNSSNSSGAATCSWYLDPYIFNITRSATAYRGYVPAYKMPAIGYYFYTSGKSLCHCNGPGDSCPANLLGRFGIVLDPNNCPDINVLDIAIVPWQGALLMTDTGYFYIVYYNGSWRYLGGPWSIKARIVNVNISVSREPLGPGEWRLGTIMNTGVLRVNYTRTKRFLAIYNELWVNVSISSGFIIAARSYSTLYYYYGGLKKFPSPPGVFKALGAYTKGPNYTYGLEGAGLMPVNAFIYKRC